MSVFGWEKTNGRAIEQLFNFSAAIDIRFADTNAQFQDRQFSEAELDKRAAAFKRSIFVLRMQARIDEHGASLPPVLGDVVNSL
jgi:hypothetical protein